MGKKKNTTAHQTLLWWTALLSKHLFNFSGSPSVMSSAPEQTLPSFLCYNSFFQVFKSVLTGLKFHVYETYILHFFFQKYFCNYLDFLQIVMPLNASLLNFPPYSEREVDRRRSRNYSQMQPRSFLRGRRRNGCGLFGLRSQN